MTVRKTFTFSVEPLGERSIRAICSTGDVDRMGEVVVQTGGDLSLYRQNPIVLFAHNPEHPVGTATNVNVVDGNLVAEITFADAGVSHKADEVCGLVKTGVLKAISIGFDPTKVEPMDPARPRGPKKYLAWSLAEISIVSIPANPNAIITDKSYEGEMSQSSAAPAATKSRLVVKDLYQVGCLARLMESLGGMHSWSAWEEACEGDTASDMPAKLLALLHGMGDALKDMVAEEVAEALACANSKQDELTAVQEDDSEAVEMSASPLMRRFRAGYASIKKDGRKVSAATADVIQDAIDSHKALMKAHTEHKKCMMAMKKLVQPGDADTEDVDSPEDDTASKALDVAVTKIERMQRALDFLTRSAA